jgi:predicted lipase
MRQAIIRRLNPDRPVIVTGHSLGAMLAQIASLDLALAGFDVINITFSTPPVGNAKFAELYNARVRTSKHFVLQGDPMHHLDMWRSRRSKYTDVRGLQLVQVGEPSLLYACPK